ncbi:MAG: hypothetical protein HQM10_22110 [Candidatus Riflebacteria bacterium]|nr:hypothetical protein [Candidatus Riflebacteria bacterium]
MKRKSGLSLIEILLALFFLAVAVIPVIGLLGNSLGDTEAIAKNQFAQKNARLVLDCLLDEVPFSAIIPAKGKVKTFENGDFFENVAEIVGTDNFEPHSFLKLLGNSGKNNFACGIIKDEKETPFKFTIFVFPVPSAKDFNEGAFSMAFLSRPEFENSRDGNGHSNWFSENEYVSEKILRPYDYQTATSTKLIREVLNQKTELRDFPHCVLKKILLKITWNSKAREHSMEFLTIRADI